MTDRPFLRLFAALAVSATALAAQPAADYFTVENGWMTAGSVQLSDDGSRFVAYSQGDANSVVYTNGDHPDAGFLVSKSNYSDQVVSFEFMVPPGSEAGVYLQGRYEVKLSDSQGDPLSPESAAAVAGGYDRNRDQPFPGAAPLADAAKPAGEWQSIEIRFRTLRNDEAFNKLANAYFLDITLNGFRVQRDLQVPYYTEGSFRQWEQTDGPLVFRGANGPVAIRNLQIDHANYDEVALRQGDQPSNVEQLVDQVALGKRVFTEMGCIECHATKANDTSFKTGPNLYGLFQRDPRKREVLEPATDARFLVDADRAYSKRSIRNPNAELAIAEIGPRSGEPYLPVMVPYSEELLSDAKVDAVWRYLSTLNPPEARGPVQVLVPQGGPTEYDPLEDPMELLVTDRTRVQRGSMRGVSGRSIHVGTPNGVNYTFDPRTLSIEKVWQGGFLNAAGEWENRGGGGFIPGFESKEIDLGSAGALLAPLDAAGDRIDFSFKEAVFQDWETIAASLHSEEDHLDQLAAIDAAFLGFELDSSVPDAAPVFSYRVGENRIHIQTRFAPNGRVTFRLTGKLAHAMPFAVNQGALGELDPSAGQISPDGVWTLPATDALDATLVARLPLASLVWRPEPKDFSYLEQPLAVEATNADLPAGYRSEQYLPPYDNYGRSLLFEATGIDVAPDGTIVVGTRTAGIWRLVDGRWQRFAEGLFDCLGLVVEDEQGLQIVAGQKPELTRITDVDGDGRADRFETLSDEFSYHSNYHSYLHGPARDADGGYVYLLNLLHTDEAIYKAKGLYMGTSGGYSGWAIKIGPDGAFIPFANGLRSPAGLGRGPDGRLWYADNQGEYVSTSKLFLLEQDKFYGHPSSLVDLPGKTPDSPDIQWPGVADQRERAFALFPHNLVANSPGHMAWDTTDGGFGPFSGQMFIGDQTQSRLFRVTSYTIGDITRGAVIPFGANLQSGIMRPVFLPDGSLLLGQTGRGWHAKGGKIASLQRIVWDGQTVAPAIAWAAVREAEPSYIDVRFTLPLAVDVTAQELQDAISIASWTYRDAPDYGSPELDRVVHQPGSIEITPERDRAIVNVKPAAFDPPPHATARVYHLSIDGPALYKQDAPPVLEAFVTGQ